MPDQTCRYIYLREMAEITRFGVSMDGELLSQFDQLIRQQGYANRSEALRDLVRECLVRREWEEGVEVVGVIALLYDHHHRELADRLTDLQHDYHGLVAATMHIHLDEDNCLEILAVRGARPQVQQLADLLISFKGVKHGQLVATSTGKRLR